MKANKPTNTPHFKDSNFYSRTKIQNHMCLNEFTFL